VAPLWRALLHGYSAHPLLQRTAEQRMHALQQADAAAAELAELQAGSEHLEIALIGAHLSASLRQPDAPQRYREIADAANQHHLVAHEQRACMQHAALLRAPAACPLLRRAADVLVYERQQMPVEELKANLLSGQHVVYARLIEAQIKGRQPLEATQTILESKGGAWIDLATPPRTGDPDPAWLQARETLTKWQEEQRFASEPDYAAYCQQQVQEAETVLVAATRHTARLREPQPLPSVTDVQGHMPHDSILIEYLVGTRHIFACVIASDTRPHWVKLGKVDEITSLSGRTALLLKTLQNSTNSEQRLQTALAQQQALDTQLARLYDLLLAPLESYLPAAGTLILSPDDILFAVPWAALVTPDGYLGERYALTLVPSGAVLGISRQPLDSPTAAPVAFGWAGNPPLHYIQDELTAIQQTMPTLRCVYPASRHQIRWDTAPTWLHIAAHGHIHRQTPLLSWIELADGRLLLVDVLTLNLHGTHLVTLSACDTATLPEQGGILLALAGAFLSVGAQSVLASLWKVDDQATLLLMATFYAALQQAIPLAQALAQAQQEVRRRGYEHPYYWASFQLLTRCAAPSVPISNDSTSTKQT
jgi:CHAT domain-containing protein